MRGFFRETAEEAHLLLCRLDQLAGLGERLVESHMIALTQGEIPSGVAVGGRPGDHALQQGMRLLEQGGGHGDREERVRAGKGELCHGIGESAPFGKSVGVAGGDCLAQRHGFFEACHPAGVVVQVRFELPGLPPGLEPAQTLVRRRQLLHQSRISAGVGGQTVEVFEAAPDDEQSGGSRAGQIADGVVELEKIVVGELAHVVEALLSKRFAVTGLPGFPQTADSGAADQRNHRQRRGSDRHAMPAHELSGAIKERVGAGRDGKPFQVSPDVLAQLLHGRVTPSGVLLKRRQDDRVEIALELAGETGASNSARGRRALSRRSPSEANQVESISFL